MALAEKPKILIVDDIEVNLILLETVLRKENATILRSTSGRDALVLAAENDLALIILDVSMPGMNGFELAERIRQMEHNVLTPIIFISALLYDQQSILQGYQAGAVDYLTKPFQNEALLGKVRMFMKLYQQNHELQQTSQALRESVLRYQKAEQTLLFRFRLERVVSLASARFSGRFDPESSMQFMLIDLAQLLDAKDASFLVLDYDKALVTSFVSSSGSRKISLPEPRDSFLKELFDNDSQCNVFNHYVTTDNNWYKAGKGLVATDDESNLAIPVNLGDKPYGCILITGFSGIETLEKQDFCSLGVFGTITGNALERNFTRIQLEQSEQKYRSYIENAPIGILVADSEGKAIAYNPAASAVFGKSNGDMIGKNINELLSKEFLSGNFPEFEGWMKQDRISAEFFVKSEKGTSVVRAESVRLPDNSLLIFCSDITATREMEKHLIHTERMVGIGEMATGIAHEINQPLNIISFGIDNLIHAINSKQADEEYINDKSRKIFEGIHRMRTIIDHVRTFSRSNDDFIHSRFNISDTIANALSLISEQYKSHGISINFQPDANQNLYLTGNTYKIEQVILNLLSNSRDALEEKKQISGTDFQPVIVLSASREDNHIIVKVCDNGTGIAEEHLANIFAPFYTTKEPGKGTGLGLAISYGIIKEHKGEIAFKSNPGQGTEAILKLPVDHEQQ